MLLHLPAYNRKHLHEAHSPDAMLLELLQGQHALEIHRSLLPVLCTRLQGSLPWQCTESFLTGL